MSGPAEWPQIVFIVCAILSGVTVGFLGAWRLLAWMAQERRDFEQRMIEKRAQFEARVGSLENRIEERFRAIEVFNAGTMVVLEHLKEFREEVKRQYQELAGQRGQDMAGLNRRLDALHNSARLERMIFEEENDKH